MLVNVHPMELKSDSSADLFASALKSQQADRAKHKAAEAKLKSQVEGSIAHDDGLSGKHAKPLTDAALFKMAYKSQQADLKKKDAQVAALKAQATKAHSSTPGMPTSKAERLSDAKLFEDALKEQNDERAKNKDALKLDIKAELKQKAAHADDSLKAQQKKERAELKMIMQADGTQGGKHGKPVLKAHSKPVLKVSKARTQSLATVEQHKRHKTAKAAVTKAMHVAPAHVAAAKHAAVAKAHVKLPTDSKLYKDALAREGHKPTFVHRKAHSNKEALAKAHAAMMKKKAAARAKGQESVAEEKQLVAFLDSAGGSKVKPISAPKTITNTDRARKEAKEEKAVEAEKKMRTVVKLAARYRTGRGEKSDEEHGGWAKAAINTADHTLGKGGKDEFRRTEFARADAIEASLVGPSSGASASLKGRGRTTA